MVLAIINTIYDDVAGLPYGYVTTASGAAAAAGAERLGQTPGGVSASAGGTTYYATASPESYAAAATPVGVVSIPRAAPSGAAGAAPTSPPIRAGDQYVLQRILHGAGASRPGSTGLLSLHDFSSNDIGGA